MTAAAPARRRPPRRARACRRAARRCCSSGRTPRSREARAARHAARAQRGSVTRRKQPRARRAAAAALAQVRAHPAAAAEAPTRAAIRTAAFRRPRRCDFARISASSSARADRSRRSCLRDHAALQPPRPRECVEQVLFATPDARIRRPRSPSEPCARRDHRLGRSTSRAPHPDHSGSDARATSWRACAIARRRAGAAQQPVKATRAAAALPRLDRRASDFFLRLRRSWSQLVEKCAAERGQPRYRRTPADFAALSASPSRSPRPRRSSRLRRPSAASPCLIAFSDAPGRRGPPGR